jgi:hypothetical protein
MIIPGGHYLNTSGAEKFSVGVEKNNREVNLVIVFRSVIHLLSVFQRGLPFFMMAQSQRKAAVRTRWEQEITCETMARTGSRSGAMPDLGTG